MQAVDDVGGARAAGENGDGGKDDQEAAHARASLGHALA
jgi:hypothetical protein